MPTLQELIDLTPEQARAWKRLERSVRDFRAAGGKFHSVLDTLNGYNGEHVKAIDEVGDFYTGDVSFSSIDSPGFASHADDWHGITLKDGIIIAEGE